MRNQDLTFQLSFGETKTRSVCNNAFKISPREKTMRYERP